MTTATQTPRLEENRERGSHSIQRLVRLPRVRILKNRHGNIARFLLAHRRNWWMMRPIRMGKSKVHIYGICRRGVWTNHITGLEITPSQIVVMRRVTHPKQPNDPSSATAATKRPD